MASGGFYPYNFPEVNVDQQTNYPSAAGIIKKITAEEWADMLHHTHKITEITDANGNKLGSGAGGTITAYDDTEIRNLINTMQTQLTTLVNENNEQKTIINNLQSTVTTLTEENNTLKENVSTLQTKVSDIESGSASDANGLIIDYDIDKDGTQDINGDNINN